MMAGGANAMDTTEALQKRVAALTPADTVQGMYLTCVLRAVEKEFDTARMKALREERSLPTTIVPFFRYPAVHLLNVSDGGALALAAKGLSYSDGLARMGYEIAATFFESPVGKTLVSLAGSRPHQMMRSAPSAYAATISFGERTYARRGEKEAELSYRSEHLGPEISRGVVRSGMEVGCSLPNVATFLERQVSEREFTVVARW